MLDILAQFDPLGLGALIGSILFLAGLIWVLLDNRTFEDLNQKTMGEPVARGRSASADPDAPTGGPVPGAPGDEGSDSRGPGRPSRTRRAA